MRLNSADAEVSDDLSSETTHKLRQHICRLASQELLRRNQDQTEAS